MDFLILVTGYNCQKYVSRCVESIKNQTYKNLQAILINDGSTDSTLDEIMKTARFGESRFILQHFPENNGAAKRRYDAIKKFAHSEETVVLLMGMDDELKPNCLSEIKKQYDSGKWMTYANWISNEGNTLTNEFLTFDESTHANRDYRKVRYRSTAPNTFKRFLFDQLTEEDFKLNNEWVKATTESNLMFSCLEMCGKEKIGVIYDPIYIYNVGRPDNARKRFGNNYQDTIYNNVISLPKKPLLIR